MGGRPVLNEDLVNLPNWLVLKLRIEGEDAIRVGNVELLDYRHEYDIGVAMVSRELRFRDRGGRETTLRSRRFMSMAHSHQAAIEWTLTAGELVGLRRDRHGARRPRHQQRRRALRRPRGTPPRRRLAAHVRPGDHRAARRDAPVEHLRRPGRPHARVPRRRAARRRAHAVSGGGLHPAGAQLRRAPGRAGPRREARLAVHLARPRDLRAADERRQVGRPLPRLRRGAAAPHPRVGRAVALQRRLPARQRARAAPAAAAHLPHPAGLLAAHDQPRRRRAGARPQRRGLPRPRLLGRALRLSLPHLAPARDHARAAHVPLPAPGRGARGGARGGLQRRDVPVAERQRRQRGDAGRPPQPAVGTVGPGPQPPPAPRQRGDLLQRLALPPGDRRPRLPARPRRRDHARDRALLELDRALQRRARPLRDPRRDGSRRVSREVPRGRARAGCATTPTRTSWSPGSASRRRSCSGC